MTRPVDDVEKLAIRQSLLDLQCDAFARGWLGLAMIYGAAAHRLGEEVLVSDRARLSRYRP